MTKFIQVDAAMAAFATPKAAAKAQAQGITKSRTAMRTLVAFAFDAREVPEAKDFTAGGMADDTAKAYISALNTIRTLSGHIAPENRKAELEALLEVGFADFGQAVTIVREAVAGRVGAKPGEVLSGSGATRAVLETVAKPKAGAVAAIVKARAAKVAADKAAKEAAPAGDAAASEPAGKAEPSREQKLAPRAQFQAARAALFDSLQRGKFADVGKVEKQVAMLTTVLAALDANLKDK